MPGEHNVARTFVLLAYAMIAVMGAVAFIASPSAMQEETTSILRIVWAVFLSAGGVLGLTGSAMRRAWGEVFGAPLAVGGLLMYVVPVLYRVARGSIPITGVIIAAMLLAMSALLTARWVVSYRLFRSRE